MKRKIVGMVCLTMALAYAALAQTAGDAQWDGVWEGKLDGQPSVTLTLAHDTGQLSGTLVLNIIRKEDGGQPHVAATEPHVLVDPHLEGNALSFGVRKINGSGNLLRFMVALTPEGRARIHCTNCGKDAPFVDMERAF
jgi:hypothetical protein